MKIRHQKHAKVTSFACFYAPGERLIRRVLKIANEEERHIDGPTSTCTEKCRDIWLVKKRRKSERSKTREMKTYFENICSAAHFELTPIARKWRC